MLAIQAMIDAGEIADAALVSASYCTCSHMRGGGGHFATATRFLYYWVRNTDAAISFASTIALLLDIMSNKFYFVDAISSAPMP